MLLVTLVKLEYVLMKTYDIRQQRTPMHPSLIVVNALTFILARFAPDSIA